MQAVILAGGLGTRLQPLTDKVPKAMIPVHGKPFLEYQIKLLIKGGVTNFAICIGHLGHVIREYFGDGGRFGVDIRYSHDGDTLLGTAGSLKAAEPLLANEFFLIYGDSYLFLDYRAIMRFFRGRPELGLMVIFRNENSGEISNVRASEGYVLAYEKAVPTADMKYINYGASVLRRRSLDYIPGGRFYTQEELYQDLILERELLAYEVYNPYYEVGSPEGLAAFDRLVTTGAIVN